MQITHRVVTTQGDKLPKSDYDTDYFLVHSLTGREFINEMFEYTLILRTRDEYGNLRGGLDDVLGYINKSSAKAGGSPGSNFDLKSIIGTQVNVGIQCDGKIDTPLFENNGYRQDIERLAGGVLPASIGAFTRHISGIVTRAEYLGVEGRSALYSLRLQGWIFLLSKTSDYRIFQRINIPDILRTILSKYPYPVEWRLTQTYPNLDYQVQYGETDLNFIQRLCSQNGINYWFEHNQTGHTLILADNLSAFKPMDSAAYTELYTYPPNLKLQEEYIHTFNPNQALTSGQVRLSDYQFKSPQADQTVSAYQPWETMHNELEVYEWQQGSYIDAENGGQTAAQLRMEQLRQHGQRLDGAGNLRGLQTGHSFTLRNHPTEDANRAWILLGQQFSITEIAPESGQHTFEAYTQFIVQLDTEQVRPDPVARKPIAPTQTATVVGPTNQEILTDQYGRVKVQFHWDQYGAKDENSTCWIRVSSPWSGNEYGGVHIPRIGQEVIVSFLNNDADMPIIIGRVTNPEQMPPWQLPTQQALSGFRSKEIDGQQNNHLIMDDTKGEVQIQLSSDHGLSQLNLGHITRIPDTAGRRDYRGQGFELRTDDWGAIRSAKGMLITTYGKVQGSGHIKDSLETASILKSAHNQQKSFAQLAIDHKADERGIEQTAHTALQTQSEDVAGKSSEDNSFPELTTPHLVLSSPTGIALATPQSTHLASNEHIALTSGQDVSVSVGKRLMGVAQRGISLFSQTLGIKAFAAKGKVEIQAQSDNIEIIAAKVLKLISTTKRIEITAAEEILLTAKGSYIKINGSGIEQGTSANWTVYAASKAMNGAKSLAVSFNEMPKTDFDQELFIKHFSGKAGKNLDFEMHRDTGKVQGKTTGSGSSQKQKSDFAEQVQVILKKPKK